MLEKNVCIEELIIVRDVNLVFRGMLIVIINCFLLTVSGKG